MSSRYRLLASLICGDPLALKAELDALSEGGIDGIHFDVMDGQFVPRLGLYPEYLKSVKSASTLPVDLHLMIEDPEHSIPAFIGAGLSSEDIIFVHAESTKHLHRVLRDVKNAGIRAGVALNPATPFSALEYILPEIDSVMLMAINPGILGHKLIPDMMRKIADAKHILKDFPHVSIEIDGGVSPESAALMISAGATDLVCGTSAIYKKDIPLAESAQNFRKHVDSQLAAIDTTA